MYNFYHFIAIGFEMGDRALSSSVFNKLGNMKVFGYNYVRD
jgi:hypothetical protein